MNNSDNKIFSVIDKKEFELIKKDLIETTCFISVLLAWLQLLIIVGAIIAMIIYIPNHEMSLVTKFFFTIIFISFSYLSIRSSLDGRFILAANTEGIYYRSRKIKDKYIFIGWHSIKDIKKRSAGEYPDDLDIETVFLRPTKLPRPCNGEINTGVLEQAYFDYEKRKVVDPVKERIADKDIVTVSFTHFSGNIEGTVDKLHKLKDSKKY